MAITDTAIRLSRPSDKAFKLSDGNGLVLIIQPAGSKLWRFNYRFNGRQKTLALGKYPDVSLASARRRRDAARAQVAEGIDPGEAKKERKRADKVAAANSFEAVARAWWEKWRTDRTEGTAHATIRALEIHVFPHIGDKPISTINPIDILELLRPLEARGTTDMLKRVRARIGEIYIHAIANGLAKNNPAEGLHKAVKPHTTKHRPALRVSDLREFSIRLDAVRLSVPI
ncbi:MAG: tyrosine-type recombinase/integrase, partial [Azoarcus sp.]